MMQQEMWNAPPGFRPSKSAPSSPAKPLGVSRTRSDTFHVTNKVPVGDTPYVRAKNVQLVDKDPERAIPLFWAAINAGDRVDSALKDMAIVMKQQNRAEEAIEAIKSLRARCSDQAQESLDNILLDLYKRCGRLDDQVTLLKRKLFLLQQGMAFNGKRTKTARSQGKKFQVSVEQEATRLLGNLGWALMQQNNYIEAEEAYRRALLLAADNNKMCNLGICLMKQGRIGEAKGTLRRVKPAVADGPRGIDSHLKAYERAQQMLRDLESEMMNKGGGDHVEQRRLFDAFLGSSLIWQPHPCKEQQRGSSTSATNSFKLEDENLFGDENVNSNIIIPGHHVEQRRLFAAFLGSSSIWQPHPCKEQQQRGSSTSSATNSFKLGDDNLFGDVNVNSNIIIPGHHVKPPPSVSLVNSLNIDARPFCCSKLGPESLKRTRSGNVPNLGKQVPFTAPGSILPEKMDGKWADFLPDSEDFEEAIIAAVLGTSGGSVLLNKVDKRLKVFQDITLSLSPRA